MYYYHRCSMLSINSCTAHNEKKFLVNLLNVDIYGRLSVLSKWLCIWLYFVLCRNAISRHCAKKPVTAMLTCPWKCTVLHCNHLGNTWKPLVLMTRHFDYCPSASEGDNQSVGSSAPVVSRCFPGGYNVKLYISRGMVSMVVTGFFAQ